MQTGDDKRAHKSSLVMINPKNSNLSAPCLRASLGQRTKKGPFHDL
jgi:hypothetical protein